MGPDFWADIGLTLGFPHHHGAAWQSLDLSLTCGTTSQLDLAAVSSSRPCLMIWTLVEPGCPPSLPCSLTGVVGQGLAEGPCLLSPWGSPMAPGPEEVPSTPCPATLPVSTGWCRACALSLDVVETLWVYCSLNTHCGWIHQPLIFFPLTT